MSNVIRHKHMTAEREIPSTIGRLLAELSWVGSTIRDYRSGGRGFENVLTAEALQALDLLPRSRFLGEVLARTHGAAEARATLVREAESVKFRLLPGDHYLRPSASAHQARISVQPDGILESPSAYVVVEAKRLRRGSFQPRQLAREYALAIRNAASKRPVLLLLLPSPPPVPIKGMKPQPLADAIALHLQDALDKCDGVPISVAQALARVEDIVCWITWHELLAALKDQLAKLQSCEPSIHASMARIVGTVEDAIVWHGEG